MTESINSKRVQADATSTTREFGKYEDFAVVTTPAGYTEEEDRRVLRKIDFYILPMVSKGPPEAEAYRPIDLTERACLQTAL